MWISFVFNIFSFVIISTLVDPDQLRYLKKRNIECGIVSEGKTERVSTRIVNGKPSSDTYPWMVEVILKLYADTNYISSNDDDYDVFPTTGSLISDKAVLTCAHCICNEEEPNEDSPYIVTCGQEDPSGTNKENLNIKGRNEINAFFGKKTPAKANDLPFDDSIEAYVYKYELNKVPTGPRTAITFDNGDIGILIIKKTIGIQLEKIAPICLPVPAAYEKKSAIGVKFVGWGRRSKSVQFKPNGKVDDHYCLTNGAREPDYQLYPYTGGISIVQCDYNKARKKFCQGGEHDSIGFSNRKIKTLSYKTHIMFNKNMIDKIERDPSYKKCVVYMKSAANKWAIAKRKMNPFKTHEGLKEIFHKDIDRIEIRDTSIYGPLLEICYNVKKAGYYGICKTKSRKFVKRGNWGFCSRACHVDEFPGDDEPYEEAEFRYFDKAPQGSDNAEYLSPKHHLHHKCVDAKLTQPRFAVFVDKNKNGENIDIEYKYDGQDSLNDFASGYVQAMGRDSGGSFWTYNTIMEKQKRSVAVAILSDSDDDVKFSTKRRDLCRMGATKITNDMLKWIKEISGLR